MTGTDPDGQARQDEPPQPAEPAQPPAVRSACALVAQLVATGVRDVVLAPGSRSAPLAYAVAAAADAGLLTLHVRVDERSAAFCALGLARASEPVAAAGALLPRPVAVVTTSGTAVANLHPAVLEAHHAGVPLLLLTADRPHELRGTGANQTTDQAGLFGPAVRAIVDHPAPDGRDGEVRDLLAATTRALAAAQGARTGDPGPVQLNLALREPLVPTAPLRPDDVTPAPGAGALVVPAVHAAPHTAAPAGRTVVVAGDGAGPQARELADVRGWPLLAEPSSGARGGRNAVAAYPLVLGVDELVVDVEDVVVLGRPTLTRPVQALLGRRGVRVTVVAPAGATWPDATRNATSVLPAVPGAWFAPARGDVPAPDPRWLERWRTASEVAARVVAQATSGEGAPSGPAVARAVAEACGPDDVLVVGSSSPVRDLDLVLGPGGGLVAACRVVANRGLAGIDGTVSTATGVALAAARSGRRTRALLGDLTFLHDVGGLLRAPGEPTADLQLVVVNDDGGSIFAGLEPGGSAQRSAAEARTFERVFATPHGADLALLCAGYGVDHQRLPDVASLRHALAAPSHGVRVLEVRVERDTRRAEGLALAVRVQAAVRDAVGRA